MSSKHYKEIEQALERFKSLVYFEEALEKKKNRMFIQSDKVLVSRALMSLLELKQEKRKSK
jgi:hypothetical protein